MNSRIAIVFVLILGVALFSGSFILFPNSDQKNCRNHIEQGGGLDEYLSSIHYQQLSEDGKTVFNKALSSDDNTVTVHGEDCPDEFRYPGDTTSYYLIIKNDTPYQLETYNNKRLPYGIGDELNGVLLISGLFLILLSIGLALK